MNDLAKTLLEELFQLSLLPHKEFEDQRVFIIMRSDSGVDHPVTPWEWDRPLTAFAN